MLTKAHAVILSKEIPDTKNHTIECNTKTNAHPRTAQSFVSNPKTMMNFWIDEDAAHVIQHIYDLPHITLEKMRLGV